MAVDGQRKAGCAGLRHELPTAYPAMRRWLDDFAYRIDLGAGVFIVAGALACAEALLTVSYQVFSSARLDPATTLRDE